MDASQTIDFSLSLTKQQLKLLHPSLIPKIDFSEIEPEHIPITLIPDFILNVIGDMQWYCISQKDNLSLPFLRKWSHKIDWGQHIAHRTQISIQFVDKFIDHIDWDSVSARSMTKNVLIKYKDKIDWRSFKDHNYHDFHTLSDAFKIELQLKGYL